MGVPFIKQELDSGSSYLPLSDQDGFVMGRGNVHEINKERNPFAENLDSPKTNGADGVSFLMRLVPTSVLPLEYRSIATSGWANVQNVFRKN
jgi:hypothetical protein